MRRAIIRFSTAIYVSLNCLLKIVREHLIYGLENKNQFHLFSTPYQQRYR